MKTCFLIGHRDVPEELRERLEKAIDEAIMRDGVTEFVVGQYIRPKLGTARRRFFGGGVLPCPFLINYFLGGH